MMKVPAYLYTLLACLFIFQSCAKEENRVTNIPEMPVYIDINYKTEPAFDNPFHYKKYYTGKDNTRAAGYVGVLAISLYNSNGTIDVSAYELCCPNEAPQKNELQLKSDNWTMECPKCKSVFSLISGGKVSSGPSSDNLKRYAVRKNDVFYQIRN